MKLKIRFFILRIKHILCSNIYCSVQTYSKRLVTVFVFPVQYCGPQHEAAYRDEVTHVIRVMYDVRTKSVRL